jgi:hypothetical protein
MQHILGAVLVLVNIDAWCGTFSVLCSYLSKLMWLCSHCGRSRGQTEHFSPDMQATIAP